MHYKPYHKDFTESNKKKNTLKEGQSLMIKLINKSLFTQKTETREKRDGGEYFLTAFKSAVKTPNPKLKGESSARSIISVIHSEQGNFNQQNTKVDAFLGKNSNTVVRLSQGDYKYDNDVYLIAIPYSGIMVPIHGSKDYRIYRGVTVRAAKRTIEFEGKKYNKIAFLVLTVNPKVFDESNKFFKDHIDFSIETYNLENGDGDEKKTVKTTVTITLYPDKDPEYTSESQEAEAIDPDAYKGQKVFPFYRLNPDNKRKFRDESKDKATSYTKKVNKDEEDDAADFDPEDDVPSETDGSPSIGTPVIPKGTSLDEMLEEVRRAEKENRRANNNRMNGKKKHKRR